MARTSIEDPLKNFRFRVEVDGISRAGFSEVSGLQRETDVVEYREGGSNETPQKSAGLSKFADITLDRGQIIGSNQGGDDDFYNWAQDVHDTATGGNSLQYRKDLDIVQYNSLNVEVRRWTIEQAWPKLYKPFSDLQGLGTENSIERLVIAHEGFDKVPAQTP